MYKNKNFITNDVLNEHKNLQILIELWNNFVNEKYLYFQFYFIFSRNCL